VQAKGGEYAHFARFGQDAADLPERDPLRAEGRTSVIHFSRYMPWSAHYGVPSIMPAWNRMVLMVLECEYNLGFFQNNAIPDYAVILDGEWEDDASKVIEQYFRTHLKGQAHKTLTMQAPTGGKVTFQKLTSDAAKEGAFRLLRIDCRDEVLHAHGVPPQKVGIVETGKLGGNLSTEQLREYKDSTVDPGREKVQARLTRLIEIGFGASGLKFEFEPYTLDDRLLNAQIDEKYIANAVVTPNEVRRERFPEREPLEGGDEPRRPATSGDLFGVEEALQQTQREIREAIAQ
jgi:capsid portal protein